MIERSSSAASFWGGTGRCRKAAALLLFFKGSVEIENTDDGNRFILNHRVEAESVQ